MNIGTINNIGFKGYLAVKNGHKTHHINTDTIQEIIKNPYNNNVTIWYQDEKDRADYPKVVILDKDNNYQNVLNAYTAASQNPNVIINA